MKPLRAVNPSTGEAFTWDGETWVPDQAPPPIPTEPVAQAPEPSFGSRVNEFTSGVNSGLANILGLPVDVIGSGLNALGLPVEDPFGGSASIKRGLENIGIEDYEPTDRTGRMVRRVGEELGATSVPVAGALGKAKQVARTGEELGGLARFFVQPFVKKPIQAAATEAALATGAGAGAGLANESFGPSPAGDITGAVGGSLAVGGTMGLANLIKNAVKAALSPERTATRIVREEVGETLSKNTVDPDQAFGPSFVESKNLEANIPGYRMTTGEATRDPGLQALEYSRRSSGPNVGAFQQRRTESNQAINAALEAEAPKAKTDEATRMELERRREKAIGTAKTIEAKKGAQAEGAADAITPDLSKQEAGREIRQTMERGRDTMESIRDAEALPLLKRAEESGASVDTKPVLDLIDEKLAVDKRESVRSALAGARSKMMKPGTDEVDTTVSGLYEARKAINDSIAGKGDRPTDRFAKKELIDVRNSLDAQINAVAPEFGDYLKKYGAGSRNVDPYKQGATGAVLETDISGRAAIPDSEVAAQFWKSGNASKEAIQEFDINAGGNKNAVKALRAYAIDDAMRAATTPDGTVSPKALESWIKKHKDALDAYPQIREELGNVVNARKTLERYRKRTALLEGSLTDPKKSTIAKYLDRETAKDSVQAILQSPNPRKEMTNLVRTIRRDPDAIEGAKRGLWDLMREGSTKSPRSGILATTEDNVGGSFVKAAAFKDFMRKHEGALQILYKDNPAHLNRIKRIASAVAAGQRTTGIKPPGSSGTALGLRDATVPGLTVAGITSRGYAIIRGVVSLPYVVLETGSRAARRAYLNLKADRMNELLDRALLDPEIAKTLVMEYKEGTQNIVAKRLRMHLGNEASVWVSDKPGEDEKDGSE